MDIYEELRDGTVVRILTSPDVNPKTEWLNKIKTPRARYAIRNWLETQKRKRSRDFGRKILTLEMERFNLNLIDIEDTVQFKNMLSKLHISNTNELQMKLGRGILTTRQVISNLVPKKSTIALFEKPLQDLQVCSNDFSAMNTFEHLE